jgi:hypothetical protein
LRQPNLYAEELWKRNWPLSPVLLVVGGVLAVIYQHSKDLPLLLAECVGGAALILIFFGAFRRYSYVKVTEGGLRFNWTFPFTNTVVPFDAIRSTRVGDLRAFYPENRKSYINAMTKPLLDKPAFFARLGGDAATVARVSKRLGRRYVVDGTIAVPVPDPKSLSQEVSQRLPNRQLQQNLGGAKRHKRRR